jgi:hypothetical protein
MGGTQVNAGFLEDGAMLLPSPACAPNDAAAFL